MSFRSQLVLLLISFLISLKVACGKQTEALSEAVGKGNSLTIMQFNTYIGGNWVKDGPKKIFNHIRIKNPDFVTLQEVKSHSFLSTLVGQLGPEWSYIGRNTTEPDVAVLTKHKIVDSTVNGSTGVRAKVQMQFADGSNTTVNVWSMHLTYRDYGPYSACQLPKVSDQRLNDGEHLKGTGLKGRVENVRDIMNMSAFKQDMQRTNDELMLMAGDLNCPSHLDWIESTKEKHCGWVYEWPATKLLTDAGLTDAFRQVYPDPAKVSGDTWSPVEKFMGGKDHGTPEPQDRIDMVFYNSSKWSPVSAEVYFGDQPVQIKPNVWNNDWPSDHASVIMRFKRV